MSIFLQLQVQSPFVNMLKIFIALASLVVLASGHGYIKEPLARHALFLRPELNTQPPYEWNYSGVECGNQDMQYSSCGRCGSEAQWGDTGRYNQGGELDKGIIVSTYAAGSVVEMQGVMTASHYGYWEIELCPQETETDNCFQKLQILGGSEEVRGGNRICTPYDNSQERPITARVQLPAGVRCNRCTIRWTYRTSYPGRPDWDICDNPYPAQVFRNCADVKIV